MVSNTRPIPANHRLSCLGSVDRPPQGASCSQEGKEEQSPKSSMRNGDFICKKWPFEKETGQQNSPRQAHGEYEDEAVVPKGKVDAMKANHETQMKELQERF